jgi:hypothetical protein
MYRLWSEWDIFHEGLIFKTEEDALKFLKESEEVKELIDDSDEWETVEDIIADGLFSIEEVDVYGG